MQKHQHFGIYALILNENKTHILLIKKARGPYTGKLDLPGGTPEAKETSTETLKREVFEETGARVISFEELGLFDLKFQYSMNQEKYELNHKGYVFDTKISNAILADINSPDSTGCLWVEIKNLPEMNVTPPVMEAVTMYTDHLNT